MVTRTRPSNDAPEVEANRTDPPHHARSRVKPASANRHTRRIEFAIVVAMCVAGIWFLCGQLITSHFRVVPGDLGDSRFNAAVFEHGFRFIRGDAWHRPFWSPRWSFFPHQNVLAYSDNLLGTMPLYVALRAVGFSTFAALDVWVILISIANFVAMYWLLRDLKTSRIGAALGGFVFAFAMPRGEHLNHLQLYPQFFTPLCFLCLSRLRLQQPRWVWGAFACAVLQIYAGIYLGWFLALALGLAAIVSVAMAAFSPTFRASILHGVKRLWVHLSAAVLVSAVALVPLAIPYSRAQAEVGRRRYEQIIGMLPHPQSYLLPADYTVLYRSLLRFKASAGIAHEQVMFAGVVVIACMVALLVSLRKRASTNSENWWRYVFAGIWVLTVATTLWINGSLWRFVHEVVPGGGAIRAVARIVLLQLLPLGAAAAWVATRIQQRAGWIGATLFAAVVVLENSGRANYHFEVTTHDQRVHRIEAQLAKRHCSKFFVSGSDKPYEVQLDAMWASLDSRIPTVNGYSGNEPPTWPFKDPHSSRRYRVKWWLTRQGASVADLCMVKE